MYRVGVRGGGGDFLYFLFLYLSHENYGEKSPTGKVMKTSFSQLPISWVGVFSYVCVCVAVLFVCLFLHFLPFQIKRTLFMCISRYFYVDIIERSMNKCICAVRFMI